MLHHIDVASFQENVQLNVSKFIHILSVCDSLRKMPYGVAFGHLTVT